MDVLENSAKGRFSESVSNIQYEIASKMEDVTWKILSDKLSTIFFLQERNRMAKTIFFSVLE